MTAIHGIKRRIRSVSSTRQITKAMQLVAASKLKRAQDMATGPADYAEAARQILIGLSGTADVRQHPFFQVRQPRRALSVLVAGDRGMAGAYNANVLKTFVQHFGRTKLPHSVISVGRHAARQVARMNDVSQISAYQIDGPDAFTEIVRPVLREISELYISGKVDVVHLLFTKFHSTVKQEVRAVQLLPIVAPANTTPPDSTLEPEASELIDIATRRLMEAQILSAVLESRASEEASRMMAMMNATDNAAELIDDLTLAFNNARQAAITQELAEISAGAEAITQ